VLRGEVGGGCRGGKSHCHDMGGAGGGRIGRQTVLPHVTGSHVFNKCRETLDMSLEIGDIEDMSPTRHDMSATCAT